MRSEIELSQFLRIILPVFVFLVNSKEGAHTREIADSDLLSLFANVQAHRVHRNSIFTTALNETKDTKGIAKNYSAL